VYKWVHIQNAGRTAAGGEPGQLQIVDSFEVERRVANFASARALRRT
jgi:hypothetical protein